MSFDAPVAEPTVPEITSDFQTVQDVQRYLEDLGFFLKDMKNDMYGQEFFKAQLIEYSTNAVADTEDTVQHKLGYVPKYVTTIYIDKGGVVYDSGTAWDNRTIYLKCSAAGATAQILVV